MRHFFFFFLLFLLPVPISAQHNYKISYIKSSNGKVVIPQDTIILYSSPSENWLTNTSILANKAEFPFEQTLVYPQQKNYISFTQLNSKKSIATKDSTAIAKQEFEILPEYKTILGYQCQKAKTIINSNTIELWFTKSLHNYGAPTILGQNLGLVLEMVRNGNFAITATLIKKIKPLPSLPKFQKSNLLDMLTYKDLVWKSRFTTIPIFEKELVRFSEEAKSNDSILRFANGTIILKKVKFPTIPTASSIFVSLEEQSYGDAYDRTGSVFLIPTNSKISFLQALQNGIQTIPAYTNGNTKVYAGVTKTEDYSPLVEFMRFFTPFGIKKFNHLTLKDKKWEELVSYRQDISEYQTLLSGQEHWIGVFIGNYDKGGHQVQLEITIHKEDTSTNKPTFLLPLFNTTNVMEMAGQEYGTMFNDPDGLVVNFTLEKDINNAKLRYTTTGHGGWENGDEFVPKKNTIVLDGKEIYSFTPWRQDCGSYRLYNPASGNFPNGLSSSDYSRANWCPGTLTNPTYIDLGNLKAGKHSIQVVIPQGAPEGTSFSAWNVSGVLLGN